MASRRGKDESNEQQLALARREEELARREQALAEREAAPLRTVDVSPVERSQSSMIQRARTEIEASFQVARAQPRDLDLVRARLIQVARNPSFAEKALYTLPRGGKKIIGESIRFAEECLRYYGNVHSSRRVVHEDRHARTIAVKLTDLESNITVEQEVEVPKVVERKKPQQGDVVLGSRLNSQQEEVFLVEATLDDMRMKEGAEVARVRRNLILELVPSWVRRDVRDEVDRTLTAGYKADPQGTTKRMLQAYADRGIPAPSVKEYLGRDEVGQLSSAEYEELRGAMVAMMESGVTWGEILEAKLATRGTTEAEKKQEATAQVAQLRERGRAKIAEEKAGEKKPDQPAAAPAAPAPTTPKVEVPRDDPKAEAGSFAREPAREEEPPHPAEEHTPPPTDEEAITGLTQLIAAAGTDVKALEAIRDSMAQYPKGGTVRTTVGPLWESAMANARRGSR